MQNRYRVATLLRETTQMLNEAGIDVRADAELLLAHVLGVSRGRVQALTVLGGELTEQQRARVLDLASERARRVPLQHLIGRACFRRLELEVGPGVFVPRPETEVVAQLAIDALAVRQEPPIAVDLCTGSGVIALSIACEVPGVSVWAVERSAEAHAWAERNVAAFGNGRVTLVRGDVADSATLLAPVLGRAAVVVANPPYVPLQMVPRDPEVRDHDPSLALYGGADGLDVVRVISRVAGDLLAPGGMLVLEHGELQGSAVRGILAEDRWRAACTHRDLTGRDRATTALR